MHNALALGHIDFVHAVGQGQRLGLVQGLFACIVLQGGFELVGRKKLLRFAAGLSALAVVAPIDVGHGMLSREELEIG